MLLDFLGEVFVAVDVLVCVAIGVRTMHSECRSDFLAILKNSC